MRQGFALLNIWVPADQSHIVGTQERVNSLCDFDMLVSVLIFMDILGSKPLITSYVNSFLNICQ